MMDDTISAIATALGVGSIGVIRVSGPDSLAIVRRFFAGREQPGRENARKLLYGHILDGKGQVVDEVLAVYMPGPHSYTGEDVCEIQCHGGREALQEILGLTFQAGARPAEPGEFTKRAFLNGRLDLAEAESVMDIINARSRQALAAANRGHEGGLSRQVKALRKTLRDLVVQLEACIDYPEDDIEEVTYDRTVSTLEEGKKAVETLVRRGTAGRILREGLRTAIVGRPNVGKSSLLNSLLQADRAIVSNIPGTTRDIIEEQMTIGGIPLVLTDTAGLRDTSDLVEKIGVERSRAALEDAQLALVVLDGSQPLDPEDRQLLESLRDRKKLILVNKADLPLALDVEGLRKTYGEKDVLVLSVKEGKGLEQVEQWLRDFVYGEGSDSESSSMTQNARQQNLLEKALQSLEDALAGARQHLPYDCLTIDLTQALHDLGEITGEDVPDEIIDEIFAQFCVGK
ncbi:tRNA uridine-5-carboxymethylaminomethyl(34) synthesis GTPase MnmE [Acidaminococcus fermentans]|uniref:tRNA uridine-5-carboxymethylaminomethyl(34) synthesis GTPase MnmE n=1 Tax=Acidaminococcus fermentans TaxID=905 RepID=UPI00242BC8E3|nr:tRNA uridine-5-carboxymethylaminomethyl(34) synthesis GTPase MnmE [Acidaminococcus fermentans]MDD6287710.1 tRNA uridine-5-carboxymethylaminomethyl(34) synthesis GTPase MnmE [Acidaminococcus fermentans]